MNPIKGHKTAIEAYRELAACMKEQSLLPQNNDRDWNISVDDDESERATEIIRRIRACIGANLISSKVDRIQEILKLAISDGLIGEKSTINADSEIKIILPSKVGRSNVAFQLCT